MQTIFKPKEVTNGYNGRDNRRAPEQTIKGLMKFLTTILSDSMEKCQTMHGEIKPVYPGLMKNEGLTFFYGLNRVVGEMTPTLGGDEEIEIL